MPCAVIHLGYYFGALSGTSEIPISPSLFSTSPSPAFTRSTHRTAKGSPFHTPPPSPFHYHPSVSSSSLLGFVVLRIMYSRARYVPYPTCNLGAWRQGTGDKEFQEREFRDAVALIRACTPLESIAQSGTALPQASLHYLHQTRCERKAHQNTP